jgi:hypothetical protein
MIQKAPALAAVLLLLPLAGQAGDSDPKSPSLELACAVAQAVEFQLVCRELVLFRHDDERRLGEELGQLLDATARLKAIKLLEAELAEKGRAPGVGKDCPPGRPLCAFPAAALTAFKEGLGPAGK